MSFKTVEVFDKTWYIKRQGVGMGEEEIIKAELNQKTWLAAKTCYKKPTKQRC